MKKIIFTAITLIAFAGTSMANDITEKEVINTESKEFLLKEMRVTNMLAENLEQDMIKLDKSLEDTIEFIQGNMKSLICCF